MRRLSALQRAFFAAIGAGATSAVIGVANGVAHPAHEAAAASGQTWARFAEVGLASFTITGVVAFIAFGLALTLWAQLVTRASD